MSSNRAELVRNAIGFLSDPKIQSAPLTQRLAFLESKGMTAAEIEEAMRLSASSTSGGGGVSSAFPQAQMQSMGYATVPTIPQRDWRDYFIMAVISGGVMFGIVSLVRKYLLPHLRPPEQTAFESSRDALTEQFDAIAASIKAIESEATAARTAVDEQKAQVDKAAEEIASVVKEVREGEQRNREEWKEVREEVENIKEMLPKMLEKHQQSQSLTLAELQAELKSLKVLLLSRRQDNSTPGSPVPGFVGSSGRPSIPAWQLATPSTPEVKGGDDTPVAP